MEEELGGKICKAKVYAECLEEDGDEEEDGGGGYAFGGVSGDFMLFVCVRFWIMVWREEGAHRRGQFL